VSRILRLRCSALRHISAHACTVPFAPLIIATPRLQAAAEQQGPSKTAISRLKVAQLRSQLLAVGLPTDGLKPQLVERLLSFQRHQVRDDDDKAQLSSTSDYAEHHPDCNSHVEAAGGEDTHAAASLSRQTAGPDAEREGVQPAFSNEQEAVSTVGTAGTCDGHCRHPACEPMVRNQAICHLSSPHTLHRDGRRCKSSACCHRARAARRSTAAVPSANVSATAAERPCCAVAGAAWSACPFAAIRATAPPVLAVTHARTHRRCNIDCRTSAA